MAQRTEDRDHPAVRRRSPGRAEYDAVGAARTLTLVVLLIVGFSAFRTPPLPPRDRGAQDLDSDPAAFLQAVRGEIDAGGALAVEQVASVAEAFESLKASATSAERVRELLDQQLEIFVACPHATVRRALLSLTHQQRAVLFQREGHVTEACRELEAALAVTSDLLERARLHARLADLLRHLGDWSAASRTLEQGEQLLAQAPDGPGIHAARAELAKMGCLLEQELGRLDLAWRNYQRVADESLAGLRMRADALTEIALKDDLDEAFVRAALEVLNDPAAAYEARKFAHDALRTRMDLRILSAGIDLASGFDDAAAATATAMLADPVATPANRAFASYVRGAARRAIASRGTETAESQDFEQDLLRALAGELSPDQRAFALLWLADASLLRSNLEAARARLDELDDKDDARLPLTVRSLRAAVEARYALKSSADTDLLATQRERLIAIQAELFQSWEAAHRPGGVGFLHFALRRNALGELVRLEQRIGSEQNTDGVALEHVLAAQSRGSVARALGLDTPTVPMFQEALGRETLALVYLFAPTQSYVFGVDSETVVACPLASSWKLAVPIRDFSLRFAWPPPTAEEERRQHARATQRKAEQLADELLPHALRARIAGARRLVVVGADQLEMLPFECLCVGDRWLGTWKAIEHWPSVAVGLALASRAEQPAKLQGRPVLFAQPATPPGELTELRQLDPNIEGLRQAWPGLEIRRGENATETDLRELVGTSVDALLFVVHGHFDESRALPAGLALAPSRVDDGNLWCEEVAALRSAPPLVVLAACETGRGHQRRGEDGATQMAAAWFQAGSRAVIQSPFLIEEGAAYTLIEELGRGLESGSTVGAALLRARRAIAREHEHPFYFGLVRLVGDGR